MKPLTLHTTVNGRAVSVEIAPNQTLLALLRETLGLTGTKCGCEVGECGASTVLLDGVAVNSCLVLAPQVEGRRITTVEGLAAGETLSPLQEAFLEHDAVHCGFCTPGMLMSAQDLLAHQPTPTEQDIRVAISGNLCRCSGYVQIVEAIDDAARRTPKPRSESNTREGLR
jgi:carbon-monoxide dehydrogenase small subunit